MAGPPHFLEKGNVEEGRGRERKKRRERKKENRGERMGAYRAPAESSSPFERIGKGEGLILAPSPRLPP